jgi:hypothetical protein
MKKESGPQHFLTIHEKAVVYGKYYKVKNPLILLPWQCEAYHSREYEDKSPDDTARYPRKLSSS